MPSFKSVTVHVPEVLALQAWLLFLCFFPFFSTIPKCASDFKQLEALATNMTVSEFV